MAFGDFTSYGGGGGGGAFWPGSRKQAYRWLIDLKFGTKNGIHNTSKYAKIEVIDVSTFRDMMSKNFALQEGTSHRNLHLLWPKIIPPYPFPWFLSKTKKFICSIF